MTSCVTAVVLSALAGMTLAACSSSGSSQSASTTSTTGAPQVSTPTTISTAAAGSAYLTDVAPANAALATFSAKAGAWTSSTSNTQDEADAQPATTVLRNLNTALTNGQWLAAATADVHTLIGDTGALEGALQGLSSVNLLDSSAWTATFQRNVASVGTAVALVRHDLGLPAATPAG
jgi:hypothetical protein